MKAILDNGYWVVGTNKWTASTYTQGQAERYSNTLINCDNCIDCRYCSDCIDCQYCRFCSDCRGCNDCYNCCGCNDCRGCEDFKSNPQRITSPVLGSRNSQTTYYWNNEHEQIVCGCFKGTMNEFESKIKETHGDNIYAEGYLNWIKAVKQYIELTR